MEKEQKYFAPSELIINADGSIFHLHVKPEQLADKVILVGDPGRVSLVVQHFETKECEVESREFRLPLADPLLNQKIEAFEHQGLRVTNFEKESSALAGLSTLMGHKALTCCMVIAHRLIKEANTGYKN